MNYKHAVRGFKAVIFAHHCTALHMQSGAADTCPVAHTALLIAENDNGPCSVTTAHAAHDIRAILNAHGVHAAQHIAMLAQAAFWRGDMDAHRGLVSMQNAAIQIIAAQPIAPTPYNIWKISH